MPYEHTEEDVRNIGLDIQDLKSAAEKTSVVLKQMSAMHVACPVMRVVAESLLEQLLEDHPLLGVPLMLDGTAIDDLRIIIYNAYMIGQQSERYPTMLPCTETVEGHLHEVENILREAEENGNEG